MREIIPQISPCVAVIGVPGQGCCVVLAKAPDVPSTDFDAHVRVPTTSVTILPGTIANIPYRMVSTLQKIPVLMTHSCGTGNGSCTILAQKDRKHGLQIRN